uniref:Reverse transcriptase domain-containing protein n=1 Tax=Caenorhabditis japonica TaxID=281687 RepID=A0A8R1DED9_CAEJA
MHNSHHDDEQRKNVEYFAAIRALQHAKKKHVAFAVQAQRDYDGSLDEKSPLKDHTISFHTNDFIHIHAKFNSDWWIGRIVRSHSEFGFVPTARRLANYMVSLDDPAAAPPKPEHQDRPRGIWEPPCPYTVVPSSRPIVLLGPTQQHSRLTQLLHLALREEILKYFGRQIKYIKSDIGSGQQSGDRKGARWLLGLRDAEYDRGQDEHQEVELIMRMTSKLHLVLVDSPHIHTPDDVQHLPLSPIFFLIRVSDNKFEMVIEENGLREATWRIISYLEKYIHALHYHPKEEKNRIKCITKSQGVQPAYIALLQQCYTNCTTTITPFHKKIEIPITRGVRQGDPISPNLFSACLESVFNKMSWQHLRGDEDDENDKANLLPGIRINGQNLTHLRFADDIVLVASNPKAASLMIQELVEMCGKVGLRMNTNKTKVMRNKFASQSPVNVTLNNVTTCIEEVNEYVYLGRLLNHNNELEPELHRRRRAAWAAFNNIKNTTDALSCPRIRAQLFDSIVLPALTEDIRAQSEVRDPLLVIKKKKLGWAGHIMRRNDGRWTRLVQEWYPIGEKRPVGRPRMRWSDSLKEEISLFDGNHLKTHWSTIAKDRMAWKAVIRDHIR